MKIRPFISHTGVAAPMMRNDLEVEFIASPLHSPEMNPHVLPEDGINQHGHENMAGQPNFLEPDAHAFATERFFPDGSENSDFILNQPPYRDASVLLVGKNFGIGSMQLLASIRLLQCGIRAIIAPSFGPTFFEDSIAVGLLPITVSIEVLNRLLKAVERSPGSTITVDLESMQIKHRHTGAFQLMLNDHVRTRFLNGGAAMGIQSEYEKLTEKLRAERRNRHPWLQ